MKIGTASIGSDDPPYVIAEIGVNHENDMSAAKEMIRQVARAGGNAAKFQTYKAERLASRNSPAYWDRTAEPAPSQFALFKRFDSFGPEEYRELASVCEAEGVDFLSTPFDLEAVEFLAPLVPAFKVASADINNTPLLEAVASYGKPIILSTGASTMEEVRDATVFLENHGATEVALLHCVLSYPTAMADANLNVIQTLRREFPEVVVGYSDHVPPDPHMLTLTTAYLLGACIIEKHFTNDKTRPGNDHYHAMDSADLEKTVDLIRQVRKLAGQRTKKVLEAETEARLYARRSLVAARDLEAGHRMTRSDLDIKRPGTGLPPTHLASILGKELRSSVEFDEILTLEHFEDRKDKGSAK